MNYKVFEDFCQHNGIGCIKNESMKLHTTFKIGGPADLFVSPNSKQELIAVLRELKYNKIPYFVLGKGSNLLVSDKGIEGAVISLSGLNEITVQDNFIIADAGVMLSAACVEAEKNSLSGLEFAYGIPGCVGGALYMNAGAYGGEMADVVCSAEYIDINGEIKEISLDEMKLGYRTSVFKNNGGIITSVKLSLKTSSRNEIKEKMDDYIQRRRSKQPLDFPSAGSTFKRPIGNYAGTLIEQNGLKGFSVGGAKVSEKHAGFVINSGNATCEDVRELILKIQKKVLKNNGVNLETEVIFVGR